MAIFNYFVKKSIIDWSNFSNFSYWNLLGTMLWFVIFQRFKCINIYWLQSWKKNFPSFELNSWSKSEHESLSLSLTWLDSNEIFDKFKLNLHQHHQPIYATIHNATDCHEFNLYKNKIMLNYVCSDTFAPWYVFEMRSLRNSWSIFLFLDCNYNNFILYQFWK